MSNPTKDHITLGILGGGQLGRMSAMAAARLGIECVIFTPEEDSPASQVVNHTIIADYSDIEALDTFARMVDFITYEFENIPIESVQRLAKLKLVFPDEKLLEVSQDRIAEKTFLNENDVKTARWEKIISQDDISKPLQAWNTKEIILKTTRFGYDGKGQMRFNTAEHNYRNAWDQMGKKTLIAEEIIDFACEISVIIARDENGKTQTYGPMVNEHKNHILSRTSIPAQLPASTKTQAIDITKKLAQKLNLRGVMTLEMFITKSGAILANEIAPRTHNSGHWSIDACTCSQFENHVRAVCGLPLGDATPIKAADMYNLIGEDIHKAKAYMSKKGANIHLYGKKEVREGRKMGHITIVK